MQEGYLPIDRDELKIRIEKNRERLSCGDYYQYESIFSPESYTWYGDKEGRALLAFMSHYKISGDKIPCMDKLLSELPHRLNDKGYLGPAFEDEIHEQQLSGHSWLLRGLCEHYDVFADKASLDAIIGITKGLYLSKKGRFATYPVDRDASGGDVSGSCTESCHGWVLSSDIGCAFMSIDGLSHAYSILRGSDLEELLYEMCNVYLNIDKVKLKAQTHCTLTAARGMLRMYECTHNEFYLDGAKDIMDLYVNRGGMTATYQNLNWWGRPDTWTEPCAIIDSLMLSCELYKITKEPFFRETAARIYQNGFATLQRDNGGAGTDTVVLYGVYDTLHAKMYEAYFCCTMRLAEGLFYINENADLLFYRKSGMAEKRDGIYYDGDVILTLVSGKGEEYVKEYILADGYKLSPILKYYCLPRDVIENTFQRIIF